MPKRERAKRKDLRIVNGGKRNTIDREKDIWYAVSRVADGATYKEVAEELNSRNAKYDLSERMVRLDVDAAMIEWKRENMENIESYIAKDLLRLEKMEKTILENFELSKHSLRPNEYASLMKRGMSPDEIDEMYKEKPLPGDPNFIDKLLRVQMQRMRLLGIDKGNDVGQQNIVQYQFNGIGDEALEKMADMLQDNKFKEIDEQ